MKNQYGEKNHMWKSNVINETELRKLYLEERKSIAEIGRICGCSSDVIITRLKKWGIALRSYHQQVAIDKEKGLYQRRQEKFIIQGSHKRNRKIYLKLAMDNFDWECNDCNRKETNDDFDLVVHHKDGNNFNNALANLEVLCQNCHARKHRIGKKFIGGYKK